MPKHIVLVFLLLAISLNARVTKPWESEYVEGLAAYHQGDFQTALNKLNPILRKDPTLPDPLELKALCLKATGELGAATKTYQKLLNLPTTEAKWPSYQFEIGTLYYRSGDLFQASKFLNSAIDAKFNVTASKFLLGNIAIKEKNWKRAQRLLESVSQSENESLRLASLNTLGKLYSQQKDSRRAVKSFYRVKEIALSFPERPSDPRSAATRDRILKRVAKSLRPYDRGAFFGSVSTKFSADTNVFLTADEAASGPSGFGSQLRYGLGYVGSPIRKWQLLANYGGSANYEFNRDAAESQVIDQSLSLVLTSEPLASWNYGALLDGAYLLRYSNNPSTNTLRYRSFLLSGSVGPFVRSEIGEDLYLGVELLFRPQKYFLDDETSVKFRKSGIGGEIAFVLKNTAASGFVNPSSRLAFELRDTEGTEFYSTGSRLTLNNTSYLGNRFTLFLTGGLGYTHYGQRVEKVRDDFNLQFRASSSYEFASGFLMGLNGTVERNLSNVEQTYQYTRWAVGWEMVALFS